MCHEMKKVGNHWCIPIKQTQTPPSLDDCHGIRVQCAGVLLKLHTEKLFLGGKEVVAVGRSGS